MQKKLFSELGLAPELLKAVAKVGYEEAAPIQSEAIPVLLAGKDVFLAASLLTGALWFVCRMVVMTILIPRSFSRMIR